MTTTVRPPQQYEAIAAHLREAIRTKELAAGDMLPSEAELCDRFKSSRGPVRQAMATLRSEGLISSGRGRRSIVLDSSYATETFESILSATAWIESHGMKPSSGTQLVARQPASAEIASELGLNENATIVAVERVRLADDVPVLVERMNFRMEAGRHVLGLDTDTESIHAHLSEVGVDFNNISRTISAIVADEEDARLLKINVGDPLIQVTIKGRTQASVPLEFSDFRYAAGRVSLGLNNMRGNPSPLWVEAHV